MNKSNKIFLLLIIILLIALVVVTFLYVNMRNTAKENLNRVLETAENTSIDNNMVSKNDIPEEQDYSIDTNKITYDLECYGLYDKRE